MNKKSMIFKRQQVKNTILLKFKYTENNEGT